MTFLFLVEIEYAVRNLHYQEDAGRSSKIMNWPVLWPTFSSKGDLYEGQQTIQKQFNVLLKAYGLGSEGILKTQK